MPLDKLKISKAPAAFADFARKHNGLAALVAAIQGKRGVKVSVSEKNIVLEIDQVALAEIVDSLIASDADISTRIHDLAYEAAEEFFADYTNENVYNVCIANVVTPVTFITKA